jgi:MFS family permease
MVASFAVCGACACLYPLLRSLAPIIALGTLEACGFVLIEPTLFAVIGDTGPTSERGRAMGIGGLFQFGGSAFGAAVLGTLYGFGEGIAFWGAGAALFAAALVCALALPPRPAGMPAPDVAQATAMLPVDS